MSAVTSAASVAASIAEERGAPKLALDPRSQLLADFTSISLEQLERVALLNRVDTKYLLRESDLLATLPALANEYQVLEIAGVRQHSYRTLYFDTSDFRLYHQHRTGQAVRHKVRSRVYSDSGLAFLEVKTRTDTGRTAKYRQPTTTLLSEIGVAGRAFITDRTPLDPKSLQTVLGNEFLRVTLVHDRDAERLTLDFQIRFDAGGMTTLLPGMAIAELKQAESNSESPFIRAMRAAGVQPTSVSKYCVGVAQLYPGIPHDLFEPTLQAIDQLTRGAINV